MMEKTLKYGDDMKKIKFLHAADLHIDSAFKGLTQLPPAIFEDVRKSTFHAFDRLIDAAILYQVDFVLLVGDLFDHEQKSLIAQIHLRNGFLKLQSYNILVYISYGNHDFMQKDRQQVTFPDNVFVFPNENVSSFLYKRNAKEVAKIHGFSYENRAVKESKIDDYPERGNDSIFHIGMLHGSAYGNTTHHNYAPFQLTQLNQKGYDYWALGHIHKREVLQKLPPTVYPGNIQGRHRKEAGEKGCYVIEMTPDKTDLDFIPLYDFLFINIEIDIRGLKQIEGIEAILLQHIQALNEGAYLIHLQWKNVHHNQFGVHTAQYLKELEDIVNQQIMENTPWRYIYQSRMFFINIEEEKVNHLFLDEVEKAFQSMDIEQAISSLTTHPQMRKFLETPAKADLLNKAKANLARRLMPGDRGDAI